MAGGGGAAAASTPGGQELRALQVADATRTGSDLWTQASDVITATIPVPVSSVTTLGGATGCVSFLLWDLGPIVGTTGSLTAADLASLRMEMVVDTFPAGNDGRILLPFGFIFSSAAIGSVDFAADKSRWSSVYAGSGGAVANTTLATSGQNNNLSPASGAASLVTSVRVVCMVGLTPRATIYEADSLSLVTNATAISRANNGNGDDLTATWNVYAFIGAGRATTTGSTLAPAFTLYAGATRRTAP